MRYKKIKKIQRMLLMDDPHNLDRCNIPVINNTHPPQYVEFDENPSLVEQEI